MKKIIPSLAASAMLFVSLNASDSMLSEYAIALKAGTLGGALELTTNITESINARIGISGFNYSQSDSDTDITYDADLKILNISLLADYYVSNNSQFRLTGGVMYNGNKLTMNGKPTAAGTFTINNVVYNSSAVSSVDASVDFNKVAPYIGIGWGNAVKKAGWNFTADLGVMFQGAANVESSYVTTLTGAAKTQLDADIAAEQRELEDDLSGYKYYPVATIGVSYRF
ncbi:MAG: hypothetical protein Q9M32_06860 [Sulfurimonas sp.]|nr:hypothetical protein [Sulfurimonas sp.]